jgi:hypothetical protein
MNSEMLIEFLERQLGRSLDEAAPVKLRGWDVVEALWPLNDIFRPVHPLVRTVAYDWQYEASADIAIEQFAKEVGARSWDNLPVQTWRVLLERYVQLTKVALAVEADGRPLTTMPSGLSRVALTAALMLALLHGMKLPWTPGDRSSDVLPSGPPVPLRRQ